MKTQTSWKKIITALEARGWSIAEQARRSGGNPAALSHIKNGLSKAPVGMVAVKLHALHESGDRGPNYKPKRGKA